MPETTAALSLVDWTCRRYPRGAWVCSRVPDVVLIALFSFFVFLNFHPFGDVPRWTGGYTNAIVYAYVDAGYSYAGVREYLAANPAGTQTSGAGRPFYVWFVALVHWLTGGTPEAIYPWLNACSFTLAALVLYVLCASGYGLSRLSSFFAAIWLLLLPDVLMVYGAQAHPEGLALFFIGLSVLLYMRGWLILAAVPMMLAAMSHESGFFLLPYFALDLAFVHRQRPVQLARSLAPFVVAAAVAMDVKILLLSGSSSVSPFESLRGVANFVRPYAFSYLAYNYEVLWIPFFCQAAEESTGRRAALLTYALPAAVILPVSADWFRVLVPVTFFFVMPMAARFVSSCFAGAGRRGWEIGVYVLLTLFLFKQTAFDTWQQVPLVNYMVTFGVLLAGSRLTRAPDLVASHDATP